MIILTTFLVLLLPGKGLVEGSNDLQTAACYTDIDCTGSIIPLQPTVTAKDCCVGTNNGLSYFYDGNCTIHICKG